MILTCPQCAAQFVLPIEIDDKGRKVRCSSCAHIWRAYPTQDDPLPLVEAPVRTGQVVAPQQKIDASFSDVLNAAATRAQTKGYDLETPQESVETTAALARLRDLLEAENSTPVTEFSLSQDHKSDDDGDSPDHAIPSPPRSSAKTPSINQASNFKVPDKANRVSYSGVIAMVLSAVTTMALGLGGVVMAAKPLVAAYPPLNGILYRLGHPVLSQGEGLALAHLTIEWVEGRAGQSSFQIAAEVTNKTNQTLSIPPLEITSFDAAGQVIVKELASLPFSSLAPHEVKPMTVRVDKAPPLAVKASVQFLPAAEPVKKDPSDEQSQEHQGLYKQSQEEMSN